MLDIKFLRENVDIVKKNIQNKFQDHKLPLVDEVLVLDKEIRELKLEGDNLRSERNLVSGEIGALMRDKKIEEANVIKEKVSKMGTEIDELTKKEEELIKSSSGGIFSILAEALITKCHRRLP